MKNYHYFKKIDTTLQFYYLKMFSYIKKAWNYFCFCIESIITYTVSCFSCEEWSKKRKFTKTRLNIRLWAQHELASEKIKLI